MGENILAFVFDVDFFFFSSFSWALMVECAENSVITALRCKKEEQGHRQRDKKKNEETPHLWIVIYTYLSYRPRPLILIGTLKVDEHTAHKHTPLSFKVRQSHQPE